MREDRVRKIGHAKMEYTQRVWIMYIIAFSLKFLTAEKHLFLGAAKLNQYKGILTLKFESKDMLL